MLIVAKRIEIFELNETKIKRSQFQEVNDKFGSNWVIHGNGDHAEEVEEDSIWIGWDPMKWDEKVKSITK